MSKAQRRILKSAEEFIGTREKESERIKKAIGQRFFCANLDEQHAVIAPRFVRGKGTQPPWPKSYTAKPTPSGSSQNLSLIVCSPESAWRRHYLQAT
jgi:hypothetical protein